MFSHELEFFCCIHILFHLTFDPRLLFCWLLPAASFNAKLSIEDLRIRRFCNKQQNSSPSGNIWIFPTREKLLVFKHSIATLSVESRLSRISWGEDVKKSSAYLGTWDYQDIWCCNKTSNRCSTSCHAVEDMEMMTSNRIVFLFQWIGVTLLTFHTASGCRYTWTAQSDSMDNKNRLVLGNTSQTEVNNCNTATKIERERAIQSLIPGIESRVKA